MVKIETLDCAPEEVSPALALWNAQTAVPMRQKELQLEESSIAKAKEIPPLSYRPSIPQLPSPQLPSPEKAIGLVDSTRQTLSEKAQLIRESIQAVKDEPVSPRKSLEMTLINTLERLHTVSYKQIDLQVKILEELETELARLNTENMEKLKESSEKTKENSFWTFLKKIGSLILSAISFIFGVSLITTGAAAVLGAVMIVSSIMAIANLVMSEAGLWGWVAKQLAGENEELKKQLEFYLPLAFGILTAAVGLAGGAAAVYWGTFNLMEKILIVAQAAVNMAEGIAEIGDGVTKYKMGMSQIDLTRLKRDLFVGEHRIEKAMIGMERTTEAMSKVAANSHQMIDLTIKSKKRIVTDNM
jgi:methyl-accepting chemotaxis protein